MPGRGTSPHQSPEDAAVSIHRSDEIVRRIGVDGLGVWLRSPVGAVINTAGCQSFFVGSFGFGSGLHGGLQPKLPGFRLPPPFVSSRAHPGCAGHLAFFLVLEMRGSILA